MQGVMCEIGPFRPVELDEQADDGGQVANRVEEGGNALSDLAPALPGVDEVVQVHDDGVQIHEKPLRSPVRAPAR